MPAEYAIVLYMKLRTPAIEDIQNKTVLVRVDYNVPLEDSGSGMRVVDDRRIKASLKTLQFLLENKAKVVLIAHLGRPDSSGDKDLSLAPIAKHLAHDLGLPVSFTSEIVGEKALEAVAQLQPGNALLMENLRFHPGEKKNDPAFAQELARLGEVYIDEAFSNAHRSHASMVGVPELLPSFAGFAMQEEVEHLSGLLENPQRPLVIVLGGAKISDKVGAAEHLAQVADIVLVGGAVANSFLKAEGLEVYRSYIEEASTGNNDDNIDYVKFAEDLIESHKTEKVLKDGYIPLPKILYPLDVVAAPDLKTTDQAQMQLIDLTHGMQDTEEQEQLAYYDIGPKTIKLYSEILAQAGTIFWNGPMGVWENDLFAAGTQQIAQAIADNPNNTVVGGGDTIAALDHFKLQDHVKYVSAAGGAALTFLSGETLPGLKTLV